MRPTVLRRATVLVVDDEEPVRLLIARVMENDGYRVITAANGREALGILEEDGRRIQLVITDVSMPVMSGPELAAHLAGRPAAPLVLFTSGRQRSNLPGPLLPKPFLPEDLSDQVRRMLLPVMNGQKQFCSSVS